uniref:Para aminobenzoic acid synthetase n=1 Tax=Ganoderma boninense TaxID=34458 RepID=A0A5K1JVE7_9APHY|nr:Para aminobenzoic acid synthetase [Ganoderma boninense]
MPIDLSPWVTSYERNYAKFQGIFRLDHRIPAYFVPGNNDVGLNIDPAVARQARQRFTTHFGPLNQKIRFQNHTLVMLDAAGLVEEDYLRASKYIEYEDWTPVPHGPVEFVHSLREEDEGQPTVLFTHIPLHRPDTASCGSLREKGTIRRGVGPSYQNMLHKKTTAFLLQSITPEIVFRQVLFLQYIGVN